MTQLIIVYIILVATLTYVIYSIIIKFRIKKSSACDGCSGCTAKELISNKSLKNKI